MTFDPGHGRYQGISIVTAEEKSRADGVISRRADSDTWESRRRSQSVESRNLFVVRGQTRVHRFVGSQCSGDSRIPPAQEPAADIEDDGGTENIRIRQNCI